MQSKIYILFINKYSHKGIFFKSSAKQNYTVMPDYCRGSDRNSSILWSDSHLSPGFEWYWNDTENSLDPGCGVDGQDNKCGWPAADKTDKNCRVGAGSQCIDSDNCNMPNHISCKEDDRGASCKATCHNQDDLCPQKCGGNKHCIRAGYNPSLKLDCCLGLRKDDVECGRCWCGSANYVHSKTDPTYQYEIINDSDKGVSSYVPKTCAAHVLGKFAGIYPGDASKVKYDPRFDVEHPPPYILGAQFNPPFSPTEGSRYMQTLISKKILKNEEENENINLAVGYLDKLHSKSPDFRSDYGETINSVIGEYCTTILPNIETGPVSGKKTNTCSTDPYIEDSDVRRDYCTPFAKSTDDETKYAAINRKCYEWFRKDGWGTDASKVEAQQTAIIKKIGNKSLTSNKGVKVIKLKKTDASTKQTTEISKIIPISESRCIMRGNDPMYQIMLQSMGGAGPGDNDYCWYLPCKDNGNSMLTNKLIADQNDPKSLSKCPKEFCGVFNEFINDNEVTIENSSFSSVSACGGGAGYKPVGYKCNGGSCNKSSCDPSSDDNCYSVGDCQGQCKGFWSEIPWWAWLLIGVLLLSVIGISIWLSISAAKRRNMKSFRKTEIPARRGAG